jgi:predicted Rdx family selenoprotein
MLQGHGIDASATAGGKGQFDVVRDGELVYSKHETGRFPDEAEIASLLGL